MTRVAGHGEFSQNTVEPQVGQKWKVSALPLSAVRVHAVVLPANDTCSSRKARLIARYSANKRWHSKQWHIAMRDGSPSIVS
jgi:hypothetical protein